MSWHILAGLAFATNPQMLFLSLLEPRDCILWPRAGQVLRLGSSLMAALILNHSAKTCSAHSISDQAKRLFAKNPYKRQCSRRSALCSPWQMVGSGAAAAAAPFLQCLIQMAPSKIGDRLISALFSFAESSGGPRMLSSAFLPLLCPTSCQLHLLSKCVEGGGGVGERCSLVIDNIPPDITQIVAQDLLHGNRI